MSETKGTDAQNSEQLDGFLCQDVFDDASLYGRTLDDSARTASVIAHPCVENSDNGSNISATSATTTSTTCVQPSASDESKYKEFYKARAASAIQRINDSIEYQR